MGMNLCHKLTMLLLLSEFRGRDRVLGVIKNR